MTQHTPGRAKITFGQLVIGDYETGIVAIHLTPAKHPVGEGKANLERLVACWNACEGINPESVPDLLPALKEMTDLAERAGFETVEIREIIAKARP